MSGHTPAPWIVAPSADEGSVQIMASGNPLMVRGRSTRAKANRALLAAAPEMAELLAELRLMASNIPVVERNPRFAEINQRVLRLLSRIRGETP